MIAATRLLYRINLDNNTSRNLFFYDTPIVTTFIVLIFMYEFIPPVHIHNTYQEAPQSFILIIPTRESNNKKKKIFVGKKKAHSFIATSPTCQTLILWWKNNNFFFPSFAFRLCMNLLVRRPYNRSQCLYVII